ncbi:PREDICTED: triggering receptor expressed on myeloid cells 1-like [Galeopterus variegatus]|uniref:Triggering receptor expressed on myeloid cells 1-like n=1 Tax=Galeopterus variegatus TaxID=482537 RepID=A0ABM0SFN9_GALVR|nr:PREDICTED: triggering receptor expressed on myeloid cells 1-like [Galeopterus variegatus]
MQTPMWGNPLQQLREGGPGLASKTWIQCRDRMEGTWLWGWLRLLLLLLLLLLLGVSGFQAVGEREESRCLLEGKNLTVVCPYNIIKYAASLKAWQRVGSQGSPETLVSTETTNPNLNRAHIGRYLLEDFPTESVIRVTVTGLQRQDVGLYQCVILLSPRDPVIVHDRIRLVQCKELPVLAIVLTCGFILNKGLVFSVLFVFLWKA